MVEKINKYRISIREASKGGLNNQPLVDISDVYGFDTDKYFRHIGQGNIRASIDMILVTTNRRYFVEFKSGEYNNIKENNIKDKIMFTMLQYFGENDEKIFESKKNNCFILVVKDNLEILALQINTTSMKSYREENIYNLEKINNIIKTFKSFCFKSAEIMTVKRFAEKINIIKDKDVFLDNIITIVE